MKLTKDKLVSKRFEDKEKEIKQDDFCGHKCTLCGGGVQFCTTWLLLRIEDLETEVKQLQK